MEESLEELTNIEFPVPLYYKEVTDILFPYLSRELKCEVRHMKETHERTGSMIELEGMHEYEFVSAKINGAIHFGDVVSVLFKCNNSTRMPYLVTGIQFDVIPGNDTIQECGKEQVQSWNNTKKAILDYFNHRADLDS